MWLNVKFFTTVTHLYIQIESTPSIKWHKDISALLGTYANGQLFGIEVFLYEDPQIDQNILQTQFSGFENADMGYDLFSMVFQKQNDRSRGKGFGRSIAVGVTQAGRLACLKIPWQSLNAGTPMVDPEKALKHLTYQKGTPPH
jgi:hypothetical protein